MKSKIYMGVSAGFHDAGVSVVDDTGHILFAGHSERYSGIKNDSQLNHGIMDEALTYGDPSVIGWYERPWVKKTRQIYSGEWRKLFTDRSPQRQLAPYIIPPFPSGPAVEYFHAANVRYFPHHLSHAAAGFQTSPFETAIVVVIDAIGEWDTYSAYRASYDKHGKAQYKRIYRQIYPHSLGLFYSAMTQRCGLKPMEEEYIMMGMAAYGNSSAYREVYDMAVEADHNCTFKRNFHTGIEYEFGAQYGIETLARAAQQVTERCLNTLMKQLAINNPDIEDCVFMGGVALNCVANNDVREAWNRLWIMPNPGDCGSSLGAAALAYGKRLQWIGPYLGTNIPGFYPSEDIISELQRTGICGVATGRAEFGPRALGARSLLADPRGEDIKDRVNDIKRRQKFRPFAPMILEEHAHEYFEFPVSWDTSPYMQNTYRCKRPDLFPAIVHEDGTSRVQTVGKDGHLGVRDLLEKWYVLTDCPMLLNTSLNIRGEPMVNDRHDADRFEKEYGIKVCS